MTYKLNELQEKWLQALESGEYKQTKGRLFDGDGYCCLGLGCVAAGLRPVTGERYYYFDEEFKIAPAGVKRSLKLRSGSGSLLSPSEIGGRNVSVRSLVAANDAGATFQEIAAFIRANPESVFLPNEEEK